MGPPKLQAMVRPGWNSSAAQRRISCGVLAFEFGAEPGERLRVVGFGRHNRLPWLVDKVECLSQEYSRRFDCVNDNEH